DPFRARDLDRREAVGRRPVRPARGRRRQAPDARIPGRSQVTIRRLTEGTINRIAAGEVVERPASAVKEIVENAIDAGARNIDIAITAGGMNYIRVADDGIGMTPDELKLAVERHATSKLPRDDQGADDLSSIATLGFRGEALPSIGSIAKLEITSRVKG